MSFRWMPLLRRVHFEINIALWASFAAFLIVFTLFVVPHVNEMRAVYQAAVDAEISAENDRYCQRWGFHAGTNEYRSCLDDLRELRSSIAKRLADEIF